jgi:hypothetical protein
MLFCKIWAMCIKANLHTALGQARQGRSAARGSRLWPPSEARNLQGRFAGA